jgi:hypothetical protein
MIIPPTTRVMKINLFSQAKSDGALFRLMPVMILLLLAEVACAQFRQFPIPTRSAPSQPVKRPTIGERTRQIEPLTLPFWDDFTKTFGMYPDTSLWNNSFTVWVSDGMAINAPTLNVVTFNGVDSIGKAYSPNDNKLTGFTDSLVSARINLSAGGTKPVAVAERSSVFLSFFYQWRGNGEAPDKEDYLQLEFRNDQNAWVPVLTIRPLDTFTRDKFYTAIVPVAGDQYFHDAFQFRLRTFGRLAGPFDTWNVDYVYLNKGRTIDDVFFPDRAISSQLGPLFGEYRAMPRYHLLSETQITPPYFEIQNLRNGPIPLNFSTDGFFASSTFGADTISSPPYQTQLSKKTPIFLTTNVLDPLEHARIRLDTLPDFADANQFQPDADSTLIRLTVALQTGDNDPITGDYTPNYEPIRFTRNDTITAEYVLSNYYAYDDGKAEYSAGLLSPGDQVAYKFTLPAGLNDTLKLLQSFDIYFPPFGITSNQTVEFTIYFNDNGLPGDIGLRVPLVSITDKGVDRFQRIKFLPPLQIQDSVFYISWREPVSGRMHVGLDISNDTGDKIFVNTTGSWRQNTQVKGSLMIRPVFATGRVEDQVGVEDEVEFTLYPNPTTGNFVLSGHPDAVDIHSITGQRVSFTTEADEQKTLVQLNAPAGLYIVRYTRGNVTKTQKLIVTQPR